jgi:hypothetical protein
MRGPRERGHFAPVAEEDAIPGKRFWLSAAVAALVVALSVLVAGQVLRATQDVSPPAPAAPPSIAANAGREIGIVEQTLLRATRRGLDEREAQRESLQRYRWVDRDHGVAALPIERAMELVTDPAFMRRAFERPDAHLPLRPDGGS